MTDKIENPEEQNNLAGLKAEAESTENLPVTKAEADAAQEQARQSELAAVGTAKAAVTTLTGTLKMLFPKLEVNQQQADEFEANLAAVMKKHGFHVGGAYQEEIALITSGLFFGFTLYQGVVQQIALAHVEQDGANGTTVDHGSE